MTKKAFLSQAVRILVAIICLPLYAQATYAIPESSHVIAGDVTIQRSGHHIEITQKSNKAIVEWKNFNIGPDDSVHIQQPEGGAILIRVNSKNTKIEGKLLATGQVILVNSSRA